MFAVGTPSAVPRLSPCRTLPRILCISGLLHKKGGWATHRGDGPPFRLLCSEGGVGVHPLGADPGLEDEHVLELVRGLERVAVERGGRELATDHERPAAGGQRLRHRDGFMTAPVHSHVHPAPVVVTCDGAIGPANPVHTFALHGAVGVDVLQHPAREPVTVVSQVRVEPVLAAHADTGTGSLQLGHTAADITTHGLEVLEPERETFMRAARTEDLGEERQGPAHCLGTDAVDVHLAAAELTPAHHVSQHCGGVGQEQLADAAVSEAPAILRAHERLPVPEGAVREVLQPHEVEVGTVAARPHQGRELVHHDRLDRSHDRDGQPSRLRQLHECIQQWHTQHELVVHFHDATSQQGALASQHALVHFGPVDLQHAESLDDPVLVDAAAVVAALHVLHAADDRCYAPQELVRHHRGVPRRIEHHDLAVARDLVHDFLHLHWRDHGGRPVGEDHGAGFLLLQLILDQEAQGALQFVCRGALQSRQISRTFRQHEQHVAVVIHQAGDHARTTELHPLDTFEFRRLRQRVVPELDDGTSVVHEHFAHDRRLLHGVEFAFEQRGHGALQKYAVVTPTLRATIGT